MYYLLLLLFPGTRQLLNPECYFLFLHVKLRSFSLLFCCKICSNLLSTNIETSEENYDTGKYTVDNFQLEFLLLELLQMEITGKICFVDMWDLDSLNAYLV